MARKQLNKHIKINYYPLCKKRDYYTFIELNVESNLPKCFVFIFVLPEDGQAGLNTL